jgi:deazaflavin-dependent oxidoreductase (nitroreductase family)
MGEELAAWGKVALIETRGRVTGHATAAAVGFVERADGSLLVAAGSEDANWALNLRSEGHCRATVGELTTRYQARELHDAERSDVISSLILKYGTPAERLGRGPAFRLEPEREVRS